MTTNSNILKLYCASASSAPTRLRLSGSVFAATVAAEIASYHSHVHQARVDSAAALFIAVKRYAVKHGLPRSLQMCNVGGRGKSGAGVKVYLLTCKPEVFTSHPVKSYINVSVLGFGCKVCTFVKAGWKLVGRQLAINMRILSAS